MRGRSQRRLAANESRDPGTFDGGSSNLLRCCYVSCCSCYTPSSSCFVFATQSDIATVKLQLKTSMGLQPVRIHSWYSQHLNTLKAWAGLWMWMQKISMSTQKLQQQWHRQLLQSPSSTCSCTDTTPPPGTYSCAQQVSASCYLKHWTQPCATTILDWADSHSNWQSLRVWSVTSCYWWGSISTTSVSKSPLTAHILSGQTTARRLTRTPCEQPYRPSYTTSSLLTT